MSLLFLVFFGIYLNSPICSSARRQYINPRCSTIIFHAFLMWWNEQLVMGSQLLIPPHQKCMKILKNVFFKTYILHKLLIKFDGGLFWNATSDFSESGCGTCVAYYPPEVEWLNGYGYILRNNTLKTRVLQQMYHFTWGFILKCDIRTVRKIIEEHLGFMYCHHAVEPVVDYW